jgi:hypothetical protein
MKDREKKKTGGWEVDRRAILQKKRGSEEEELQ